MPDLSSRRISPLDLIVMLAALAAGAAMVATAWPLLIHIAANAPEQEIGPSSYAHGYYFGWTMPSLLVVESFRAVSALLAPLTAALVGLRLRPPRPPLRHLFRQAGAAGCAAASLVLVLEIANALANVLCRVDLYRSVVRCQSNVFSWIWQYPLLPTSSTIGRMVCALGEHSGMAVGGAWFGLAVSGLWRWNSDPIERLARVVALYWILAAFVFLCVP